MKDKDARTWAAVVHLGGLAGMVIHIGFANLIGVVVLWLIKRNESSFVDDQGKEAINFQILVSLIFIVVGIISGALFLGGTVFHWIFWNQFTWHWNVFPFWGVGGLFGLVNVFNLVFCILAAVRAGQGFPFRYPVSLRIVK